MFRLRIMALLITYLFKHGLTTHNRCQPTSRAVLGCLTPSHTVPKLRTYNLVCKPIHVSKWPKMLNLIPRPKPGGDSPSTRSTLGWGVLPTRIPLVTSACAHNGDFARDRKEFYLFILRVNFMVNIFFLKNQIEF